MREATWELLRTDLSQIKNADDFSDIKRRLAKKYGPGLFLHADILRELRRLQENEKLNAAEQKNAIILQKLLRKRAIRTLSGIAPVAVLTKPYPCPGHCAYCPSEKNVPALWASLLTSANPRANARSYSLPALRAWVCGHQRMPRKIRPSLSLEATARR